MSRRYRAGHQSDRHDHIPGGPARVVGDPARIGTSKAAKSAGQKKKPDKPQEEKR